MSYELTQYNSPVEAAICLAGRIETRLRRALLERGAASLVMSGGTTPKMLMELLARADLDWSRVWVTLTDERWVEEDNPASNARLVRTCLQQHYAEPLRFVSLKTDAAEPEQAVDEVSRRLRDMPRPFDAVILGMGADGHFASLFPHADALATGLDESSGVEVIAAVGAADNLPRLSLTLAALLDAHYLSLLIDGDTKAATLKEAMVPGSTGVLPIRAILHHPRAQLDIHLSQ